MLSVTFSAILILFTTLVASLQDSSKLSTSCYTFPKVDYGYGNNVKSSYHSSPKVILTAGKTAIDFTATTDQGDKVTLSTLLKSKAVLMIWGHYTCPAFQGLNSDIMFLYSSYGNESALVDEVYSKVQVLHMVSPEPHPIWPQTNFDSGMIKMNLWSTISQPQTFSQRLSTSVTLIQPMINSKATIVVDALDGADGTYNNPIWCSYAQGARSAILISTAGKVLYTQDWFNADDMKTNINSLV